MLGVDRRRELRGYLRSHGSARIAELAQALDVSLQTVRRDLAELEHEGLVTRVHGGAVATVAAEEGAALEREQVREAEKRRIAEAAAELVEPGSTIFLSGGTTTERVVPYLARLRRLTVVTNALNVATALATTPEIEVIVLGGYLRHSEMTLLGPMVEQTIGALRVGQALYGCFGLDAEEGLTGASLAEASTDRIVLDAVDRVTILADASKFAQRGPARLADVSRIATLVTDRDAPADGVARLREQGVEVITA